MSSPRLPDWRWVLLLVIGSLVVLWLAFGIPKAHGQSSESLSESEELLEQLVQRLQERLLQVQTLEADLKAISLSHDALLKQYDLLESNWQSYRTETQQIIAEDQRRLACSRNWIWALAGSTLVSLGVTIILLCR